MDNNVFECYRGDIFYIENRGEVVGSEQRSGRPGIIVSNDLANKHSPNVTVVYLTSREKKPLPTHVEVICKVPSIALCENIQTVSKERLGYFIRSCTTSEMKAIDKALLLSLSLTIVEEDLNEPTAIEIERNLYKNLYEQLLDRITVKPSTEKNENEHRRNVQ